MHIRPRLMLSLAAVCAVVLPLAACSVSVDHDDKDGKANVDVHTPVANVSVRAGEGTPDTGLQIYPGARPKQTRDQPESATVDVGGRFFGIKVAAATYESDAAPAAVAAFYRTQLQTFGAVTECRGNVDFPGGADAAPVCRADAQSREWQFAVGTRDNQRIVAIKPRGDASEFSLVHVDTRRK